MVKDAASCNKNPVTGFPLSAMLLSISGSETTLLIVFFLLFSSHQALRCSVPLLNLRIEFSAYFFSDFSSAER